MNKLNLNELMRYGFAGGNFILLIVLFDIEIPNKRDFANPAIILPLSLLIGSVVYAFHRAFPYPLLNILWAWKNKRPETIIDLDIARWKNSPKKNFNTI